MSSALTPPTVNPYVGLITSEHRKPNFCAWVSAFTQPLADAQGLLLTFPALFDLDLAVGDQLDKLGEIIGPSRVLSNPLLGLYFTLGDPIRGLGESVWYDAASPDIGVVTLTDPQYRTLLKAWILKSHWDGTGPGLRTMWQTLLAGSGVSICVQDLGNMAFALGLYGGDPNAFQLALFQANVLMCKPDGVRLAGIWWAEALPMFGFWTPTNGTPPSILAGLGSGQLVATLDNTGV